MVNKRKGLVLFCAVVLLVGGLMAQDELSPAEKQFNVAQQQYANASMAYQSKDTNAAGLCSGAIQELEAVLSHNPEVKLRFQVEQLKAFLLFMVADLQNDPTQAQTGFTDTEDQISAALTLATGMPPLEILRLEFLKPVISLRMSALDEENRVAKLRQAQSQFQSVTNQPATEDTRPWIDQAKLAAKGLLPLVLANEKLVAGDLTDLDKDFLQAAKDLQTLHKSTEIGPYALYYTYFAKYLATLYGNSDVAAFQELRNAIGNLNLNQDYPQFASSILDNLKERLGLISILCQFQVAASGDQQGQMAFNSMINTLALVQGNLQTLLQRNRELLGILLYGQNPPIQFRDNLQAAQTEFPEIHYWDGRLDYIDDRQGVDGLRSFLDAAQSMESDIRYNAMAHSAMLHLADSYFWAGNQGRAKTILQSGTDVAGTKLSIDDGYLAEGEVAIKKALEYYFQLTQNPFYNAFKNAPAGGAEATAQLLANPIQSAMQGMQTDEQRFIYAFNLGKIFLQQGGSNVVLARITFEQLAKVTKGAVRNRGILLQGAAYVLNNQHSQAVSTIAPLLNDNQFKYEANLLTGVAQILGSQVSDGVQTLRRYVDEAAQPAAAYYIGMNTNDIAYLNRAYTWDPLGWGREAQAANPNVSFNQEYKGIQDGVRSKNLPPNIGLSVMELVNQTEQQASRKRELLTFFRPNLPLPGMHEVMDIVRLPLPSTQILLRLTMSIPGVKVHVADNQGNAVPAWDNALINNTETGYQDIWPLMPYSVSASADGYYPFGVNRYWQEDKNDFAITMTPAVKYIKQSSSYLDGWNVVAGTRLKEDNYFIAFNQDRQYYILKNKGSQKLPLDFTPLAIAYDTKTASDSIYVLDARNRAVYRCSGNLKNLQKIDVEFGDLGQLSGFAVHANQLYFTSLDGKLARFALATKFLQNSGFTTSSLQGITVDANGNVYVTDPRSASVFSGSAAKFDAFAPLTEIAKAQEKGLKYPAQVLVDEDGYIYVADMMKNKVFKFNGLGIYLDDTVNDQPYDMPRCLLKKGKGVGAILYVIEKDTVVGFDAVENPDY